MRFQLVACILLILPVFSFVLAAPIPERHAHDMCADSMKGDEEIIIVSEKRAPQGSGLHASGSHPSRDLTSTGSESPMWSNVWSEPKGVEVPWDPPKSAGTMTGNPPTSAGNIKKVQWGTTAENQLASESSGETKAVQWGPTTKIFMYPEDPLPQPPGRNGYLAKVAAQTLPRPQSFGSKVKAFLGKAKFRPRSRHTPVNTA
jgi:hypothetical protein